MDSSLVKKIRGICDQTGNYSPQRGVALGGDTGIKVKLTEFGASRRVTTKNIESSTGILVDWGTTNLRAYLVDSAGKVLDTRQQGQGIRNVQDGRFAEAIENLLEGWSSELPVLMSGMIGSAQGWVEARYAECPCSAEAITEGLTVIPDFERFSIVPGISYQAPNGAYDVMRGEEVQIFGALDLSSQTDAILCLPGTHSKWATVKGGVLEKFSTSMTGEVYSILKSHSILGALMEGDEIDDAAFVRGLDRAKTEGGLLHHLFSTRTEGLFDQVGSQGLSSYMSGILVGHELKESIPDDRGETPIILVSGGVLGDLYAQALKHLEISVLNVSTEEATVHGLNLLQKTIAAKGTK